MRTRPSSEPADDRRAEPRHSVFFRTVLIESEVEGEPTEIINIARSGFLARTQMIREIGSTIALRLPVVGQRDATVTWCGKGLLGGRFTDPIDQASFSGLLASLA